MVVSGYSSLDLSANAYQDAPAYIVNATGPERYQVLPYSAANTLFPGHEYGSLTFEPGSINIVFSRNAKPDTLLARIKKGEVHLLVPDDLPKDLVARIKDSPIVGIAPQRHVLK